jgi:hypothetical protein
LARRREAERPEVFLRDDPRRAALFRLDPRVVLLRLDLRVVLLRLEPRARFLADVLPAFFADFLADFLELLREAFLAERPADVDFRLDFLALRGAALRRRSAADSPKSS